MGSTGRLPCDSWANLVPGALAKASCLSDAGSRAAPCESTRWKTSLEPPGCDGEMAAKGSRARLMATSLSPRPHPSKHPDPPQKASRRETFPGEGLACSSPTIPRSLNAFAFHYTHRKAQSASDCQEQLN